MNRDYTVNTNIKVLMVQKGLKADWLAAQVDMSKWTLYNILSARRPVYADEVPAFAKAFNVGAERLFEC